MASRVHKLRRRQRRKDKKRQRARELGGESAQTGAVLVVDPPGAAKMSEALWAVIEPEWDRCADKEAMQKLCSLASLRGMPRS